MQHFQGMGGMGRLGTDMGQPVTMGGTPPKAGGIPEMGGPFGLLGGHQGFLGGDNRLNSLTKGGSKGLGMSGPFPGQIGAY